MLSYGIERIDNYMHKYLLNSDIELYYLFTYFGALCVLFYNLKNIKQKESLLSGFSLFLIEKSAKNHKKQTFAILIHVEIIVITLIQYALPYTFPFGNLVGTGANYFGLLYFAPIVLFLFCLLVHINPFKQFDLITPAYPLGLIFAKIGCFCCGCCKGFACDWGLTNYHDPATPQKEFPVQLVEAGLALAIFLFLLWYKKRAKEGTLFPIYLIVYSITRFFSEFLRGEPVVFGVLKTYQILCIIGVILGVIELLIALKYSKKFSSAFNYSNYAWYKREKHTVNKKNVKYNKKRKSYKTK